MPGGSAQHSPHDGAQTLLSGKKNTRKQFNFLITQETTSKNIKEGNKTQFHQLCKEERKLPDVSII